jgi:arsenate reductase
VYRSEFTGKNFSDDEWVKILVEHPKLIQRPIVVKGYKAVVGDPADNIESLLT